VTASFSPASVTPLGRSSKLYSSTVTIGTTGLANGTHRFVVRATGTNGEATPLPVTHLHILEVTVGDGASGGQGDEYVDVVGFAVMRIASSDSNVITAYAISPVIPDLNDPALRRGQVARLVPW